MSFVTLMPPIQFPFVYSFFFPILRNFTFFYNLMHSFPSNSVRFPIPFSFFFPILSSQLFHLSLPHFTYITLHNSRKVNEIAVKRFKMLHPYLNPYDKHTSSTRQKLIDEKNETNPLKIQIYYLHSHYDRPLWPASRAAVKHTDIHIQKPLSAAPSLSFKAPVEVTQVFKGVFMVLMTNERDYYITERRNTLTNPALYSLWPLKIVVVRERSVSEYGPKSRTKKNGKAHN